MTTYVIVGVTSGLLFGVMDGLANANPIAVRLLSAYKPIARTSLNVIAGVAIDLAYGLALAALFLLLYPSLPGEAGLVKGLGFAAIVWFLRVAMNVASQWMMFDLPPRTLLYTLAAGLGEMLILGTLYGLTLQP